MNYKKQIKNNHTLHLIKDDKYKTINVSIRFTMPYDEELSPYFKLLERVIIYNGTKNYPTLKDLSIKTESLYRTDISTKYYINSKNMIFEFRLMFINPKYTEEKMYTETFKLLKDIMTNPRVKNNKFNENIFNVEKESLINNILNITDDPQGYGRMKFDEVFFKGTVYGTNNYSKIDKFKKITNEKLYKTYKLLFNSFKIDALVYGDFNEAKITKNIDNLLENFKQKNTTTKGLEVELQEAKQRIDKEKFNTTQSNIYVGLNIDELTEDEKNYKLLIYNTILGTMNNNVLFVNVREKNSLCYFIRSTINKYTNSIIIESGITAKNFEKAKSLIKESIDSMKDKKVVDKLLDNAKKTLQIVYNDFYDNIGKIMNYYYLNEFEISPSLEERRAESLKVTSEEICELASKIKMNYVFLLEGSINEEN